MFIKCFINIFILLAIYIVEVHVEQYNFQRIMECQVFSEKHCLKWKSILLYQTPTQPVCFPEDVYLQGREKAIKMSQLKIGDEILVEKFQRGTSFQKVTAWLHRQTLSEYQFMKLKIKFKSTLNQETEILISGLHNIAVLKQQQAQQDQYHHNLYHYKYAENVKIGDHLFGFGLLNSQAPVVTDIQHTIVKKGIYAPYNPSGNYFISSSYNQNQMVLVHCFAHVKAIYLKPFQFFMNICSIISQFTSITIHQQPKNNQKYRHPLSSILCQMFPNVLDTKQFLKFRHQITRSQHTYHDQFRYYSYREQSIEEVALQRRVIVIVQLIMSLQKQWY